MQEIHEWQTLLTFSLRQPSYMDEITLLIEIERGFDRMALIVPGRKLSNRSWNLVCSKRSADGPRLCENAGEQRMRGIVFSPCFFRQ
jgi:hypothetical protein